MRHAVTLGVLLLSCSLTVTAQVLPTSSGSCGVTASGLMSCDWLSAVPMRKADGTAISRITPGGHTELFVTRFDLAPGAPLAKMIEGYDVLILGLSDGELVNETKSPPLHISVSNGSVVLMPKEESYLLRNVGKQELDVLVVRTSR
jgi:hypothetical protein